MNLDKLLGIFAFVIAGMLVPTAIYTFAEGHYLLGVIRVMLIIANAWMGWEDLRKGFAEKKED